MANKKKILGVDIGSSLLKLVYIENGKLVTCAKVTLPDKMLQDSMMMSAEVLSDTIKDAMQENDIKANNVAFVVSGSHVYFQTLTTPQMSGEQLLLNIPYDFKDYIQDDLKDYQYDYAMISTPEEVAMRASQEKDENDDLSLARTMDILAVAIPTKQVDDLMEVAKSIRMKPLVITPVVSSYMSLIRNLNEHPNKEYCIIDFSYDAVNMYIYQGDCFRTTRRIEFGMKDIAEAIAYNKGVETNIAQRYLLNNFENCQEEDYTVNAIQTVAVDISRALNFYRFNNQESVLDDIYVVGGGSGIAPIKKLLEVATSMKVHDANDLLTYELKCEDAGIYVQAIGACLEG